MDSDKRIHVIDSLRGFALVGILLAHTTGYFVAGPMPQDMFPLVNSSWFDGIIGKASYWLIMSKFFSIFAFLFGLSFFIQMKAGEKRYADFRPRFLWRLSILALFGLVHMLFFMGDILFIYALVGMMLVPLWKRSNITLLMIAGLLLLGIGRVVPFYLAQGASLFSTTIWPDHLHFLDTVIKGGFWETVQAGFGRAAEMADRQVNTPVGRAYITLGYFLLGILVGRKGWLQDIDKHYSLILRVFYISILASIVGVYGHLYFVGGAWSIFFHKYTTWSSLLLGNIFDFQAFAMTCLYISGFLLLFHHQNKLALFTYLSAYGRTALTSYICQSVIGTFIFFNWGLGLITQLTTTQCLLVALGILVFQVIFSNIWLKHYQYGPLEWLWRSLTYMQWVPNKKR